MEGNLDHRTLERELNQLDDDEVAKLVRGYAVEGPLLTTDFCRTCGAPVERKKFGTRREALVEAVLLQLSGSAPGRWKLCESCAIELCKEAGISGDLNVGGQAKGSIVPCRKDGRACYKNWSDWLEGEDVCYLSESEIAESEAENGAVPIGTARKIGWNRSRLLTLCGGRTRLAELVLEVASGEDPQETLSALSPADMEKIARREELDSISCHKVRFASLPQGETIAVAEIWADEMEEVHLAFDGDAGLDEERILLLARRSFPYVDEIEHCKTTTIREFCEEHTSGRHWRYYPKTAEQLERAIRNVMESARKGGGR